MFQPNAMGKLARVTGRDLYARVTYGEDADCPFGRVNMAIGAQKTSVRADSSASRGSADEIAAQRAKILVPAFVEMSIEDRFTADGRVFKISVIHPRFSIAGDLDHYEVDLEVLAQ